MLPPGGEAAGCLRFRPPGPSSHALAAALPPLRDRGEQPLRVRLARMAVDVVGVRDLDDLPFAHHHDLVGDVLDDGEIVRDEDVGEPELVLQVLQQVQHLRLHRHVERRHRLVADQDVGLHREAARDRDPLPLAAGELVRVLVERDLGQAHLLQELEREVGALLRVRRRCRGSPSARSGCCRS